MKRIVPVLICFILVSCMGEMTGIISVKGNEPHAYLAFTNENGDLYRVEGPLVQDLREKYQGVRVKLKGKMIKAKDRSSIQPGIVEVTEVLKVYKD